MVYASQDSNLFLFGKLSINKQIGIHTKLNDIDESIIVKIFSMLFSKNYYTINNSISIEETLDDMDVNPDNFGVKKMFEDIMNENKYDISKWIEFFETCVNDIGNDIDGDDLVDYIDEYGTFIDGIQIYNELPEVSKCFNLRRKQIQLI